MSMPLSETANTEALEIRWPGWLGRLGALYGAAIMGFVPALTYLAQGFDPFIQAPWYAAIALNAFLFGMLLGVLLAFFSRILVVNRRANHVTIRSSLAGITLSAREIALDQIKEVEIREIGVGDGFAVFQTVLYDTRSRPLALLGQHRSRKSAQRIVEKFREFMGPKTKPSPI